MRTRISLFGIVLLAIAASAPGAAFSAPAAVERTAKAEASATLTVRGSRYGRVLFDARGRALYGFTRDPRRGKSQCYGACAAAWPVYFAKGRPVAGGGVKQSLIGTTRRRDGRLQVTYNGWPLYYYVGDRSAGQITCQDVEEFGGTWLVVRPDGRLVR